MNNRAQEILNAVLDAMQEAEERNGVEGSDYILLMSAIAQEATQNMRNCAIININELVELTGELK